MEASLSRLGVDRIDLYQLHWPAEDGTQGGVAATGFSLLAWRAAHTAQARLDLTELVGLFRAGDLRAVTTSLPLAEMVEAHRLREDRAVPGPLLLGP